MSTLVITIGGVSPIVMSGSPVSPTELGVTGYAEPAPLPNINNAQSSPYLDGSGVALSWKFEDVLLTFSVFTQTASTEAQARAAIDALRAAVSNISFPVTVNVNGAGNEVWQSNGPGAVTPASERTAVNIRTHKTEWNVSIPCYPVRVS